MGVFRRFQNWFFIEREKVKSGGNVMEETDQEYENTVGSGQTVPYPINKTLGQQVRNPLDDAPKDYNGRKVYKSRSDKEAEQMRQATMGQQGYSTIPPVPEASYLPGHQMQGYTASTQDYAQSQGYGGQVAAQPYVTHTMRESSPQPNNVLQFPGIRRELNNAVYTHVEYAVLLKSRSECESVLEYIKSNASVFLNLEYINNENERQRCVDILSGAAYVMGCHFNKISPRGMYLISAASIYVELDPALKSYVSGFEQNVYQHQNFQNISFDVPIQKTGSQNTYPSGYYNGIVPGNMPTHTNQVTTSRNTQPGQSHPFMEQKIQPEAYSSVADYQNSQMPRGGSSRRVDSNHMGRYTNPQNQ